MNQIVFITGGTGYIGSRLIPLLLECGHTVRALTRAESQGKLPTGCIPVIGNALDANSYRDQVQADTFVQLVGVAHPSPAKAAEFRSIDLVAGREAVNAAAGAGVRHFVYLSVAHPAPVMKAYIEVPAECEALIRGRGLNATIVRPWYVLGPGHRWPYVLNPVYWLAERIPGTRDGAGRLGLVTLEQMLRTLTYSVGDPVEGVRIFGVPEIRRCTFDTQHSLVTR